MKRLSFCYDMYDVVRIDHFRGFDEYYSIPYGEATARKRTLGKGTGYRFFPEKQKNFFRAKKSSPRIWGM